MEDVKVYSHPKVGKTIEWSFTILLVAVYVCAYSFIAENVGWGWAVLVFIVFLTLREMKNETVYSHSNFGIGPGRLETFLENLARGLRDAFAIHALYMAGKAIAHVASS